MENNDNIIKRMSQMYEQIQILHEKLDTSSLRSADWHETQNTLNNLTAEWTQLQDFLTSQDESVHTENEQSILRGSQCLCGKTSFGRHSPVVHCKVCDAAWHWDTEKQMFLHIKINHETPINSNQSEEHETNPMNPSKCKEKEIEANKSQNLQSKSIIHQRNKINIPKKLHSNPHTIRSGWNSDEGTCTVVRTTYTGIGRFNKKQIMTYPAGVTRSLNSNCICDNTRLCLSSHDEIHCKTCGAKWKWKYNTWVLRESMSY